MTKDPVAVEPRDTLAVAWAKMQAGSCRRLPVVDADKVVGILSEYDLKNYALNSGTNRDDGKPGHGVILSEPRTRCRTAAQA